MGTDIHVRVEYQPFADGEWHDGDFYRRNPYYGKDGHDDELEFEKEGVCEERDYFRFALLADVRNEDVSDRERIQPISRPRGVPTDCCAKVLDDIEQWRDDGHSHSYFTLKELMEWYVSHKQVFTVTGFLSPEATLALDSQGIIPEMWCGWTSDKTWAQRTWEMEVDVIGPVIEAMKKRGIELLNWGCPYDFEKDKRRIKDRIRIVFWFDN